MFPLVCREQDGHKPKASEPRPQSISLLLMFCGFFIGDNMKKIMGFGINDANYSVYSTVDGATSRCPAYVAWLAMLTRCFSDGFRKKFPTYSGVNVCEEWSSFMQFRAWWIENHVEGWDLDKDILTDKRLYSPDTCIYIPRWLNSFLQNGKASRGPFPIGVSIDRATGRFTARCKNIFYRKNGYIGKFDTAEQAYHAWLCRKLEIAFELKPRMDAIDGRIYERVVELIGRIE